MAVITMSRQLGSGAEEVANRLCQEMGLRVFDKGLMMRVATEVGFTDTQIVDYSEDQYELRSLVDALFHRMRTVAEVSTRVSTGRGPDTVDTLVLDEARAIDLIRATMHAAYERGSVLIIGRGGQAILEDKPDVVHVRIVAPVEQRIARVQDWEQCTAPQARRLIAERDRATREYLRTFHNIEVDDTTLYHLVLNTGKLNIGRCVEMIKAVALAIASPAAAVAAA